MGRNDIYAPKRLVSFELGVYDVPIAFFGRLFFDGTFGFRSRRRRPRRLLLIQNL